jgi:hypothetical protein
MTSGFVANFRQDNVTVVDQIPRKVASLPLMFVRRAGEAIDENTKFAKVCKLSNLKGKSSAGYSTSLAIPGNSGVESSWN